MAASLHLSPKPQNRPEPSKSAFQISSTGPLVGVDTREAPALEAGGSSHTLSLGSEAPSGFGKHVMLSCQRVKSGCEFVSDVENDDTATWADGIILKSTLGMFPDQASHYLSICAM